MKATELVGCGFSPGQASGAGGTYSALAATGSSQATGATTVASMSIVSAADGTKAVTLQGQAGDEIWLFNNSASTLKVYPDSGSAIAVTATGLGTANASFDHATYKNGLYKKVSSTQWFVILY